MGIKDLFSLKLNDNKKLKDLGTEVKFASLKGSKVCVDAMIMIYSAILAMQSITALSHNGKTTAHIMTCLNKVLMLKQNDINQLWVFDSAEGNIHKAAENVKRRAQKDKSEGKGAFSVTSEHVGDIINLLTFMGISYIIAPPNIEAEHLAAYLTTIYDESTNTFKQGLYDYVMTADSDILLFGGKLLCPIKKSTKKSIMKYDINDILKTSELTFNDFQKVCIALGSDFNDRIPKCGPGTVITKLKAKKIEFTDEHERILKYINTKINVKDLKIVENTGNKEKLLKFLDDYGFNIEKIIKRL